MVQPDVDTRELFASIGEVPPTNTRSLGELLRRPHMTSEKLAVFWPEIMGYAEEIRREVENIFRYQGYLDRQQDLADKSASWEKMHLPEDLPYHEVAGLTLEVVEKLSRMKPMSLGQASRISGITPAAVVCLAIHLRKMQSPRASLTC
ncbi:hypothetical protein FACS1894206_01160 [Deltaproteobacteria bacterium]|nr:hypothetical protein FACS1894206_01160 [Deltaproteobacteria bacterium]